VVTNHPSHDPDIEQLPFFAISPAFFENLWSSFHKRTMFFDHFAALAISIQHNVFYLIMAFGRFKLYADSYRFLLHKAFDTKWAEGGWWAWPLELLGIVVFWCWFGQVLVGCGSWKMALIYLLVSHIVTGPLHVQVRPPPFPILNYH
jgi:delta8-fatty-acid desaturase